MKHPLQFVAYVGLGLGALGCSAGNNNRGALGGGEGDGGAQGATNGNSNGANTSSNAGTDGGGQFCQQHSVNSSSLPPDMLIVLDRSGSMKGNGVDRWDPSVAAVEALTAAHDTTIHFGLEVFPGNGMSMVPTQDCSQLTGRAQRQCERQQSGGGGGQCDPGTVFVPVGAGAASAISKTLSGMQPSGGTPTAVSLQVARTTLASVAATPGTAQPPKYVLLVTDGAPNCTSGSAGSGQDPAAVAASVAEITTMAQAGIKTYVIGYNTASDATLSGNLNQMAAAGGTGMYIPVEDGASLEKTFNDIAGNAISCDYVLQEAPPNPTYVLVEVDGKQLNLNAPDGWKISADNKKISVQGAACKALQDGKKHTLSVQVLCKAVPVI